MTDIVERLKWQPEYWKAGEREQLMQRAADEIERLRAEALTWEAEAQGLQAKVERLRALLCSCQIANRISDECVRLGKCKERVGL